MREHVARWLRDGSERGQASVEFVAAIPLLLLVSLLVWQLAVAGHTLWLCANAARVAARAEVVGKDGERAARSALPRSLESGLEVGRAGEGVRVRVRVPFILPRWRTPITVAATAALGRGP
jgi:hypothetical protein